MKIQRMRKRPVAIEGVQIPSDPEVQMEIAKWCEGMVVKDPYRALLVPTLEGDHFARVGDWVLKGVEGEFYPCADRIFQKTYDLIEGEVE